MPEIDLPPDAFRAVRDKPLAKRGPLIGGLLFFGLMTVGGVYFAWTKGGVYAVSVAVMAAAFGVFWVGLAPGFWFRQRENSKSSSNPRG